MSESPLVSVLMAAYNSGEFIAESIESVLSSTYTNFELIIVDDCSKDDTVAIARTYETKDSRIKVYENEKNLGQFGNRNKVAAYAKGIYLKYVDCDDLIYKHSLQVMVDAMEAFPEVSLGYCDLRGQPGRPFPFVMDSIKVYELHFLKGGLLFSGPSAIIIRRKYFEKVKGFQEFGMPSDNHLNLKLAGVGPVLMLQRDLFFWRTHDGQLTFKNINNFDNILNNYNFSKDIINNYSPLTAKENRQILRNLNKIFYKNIVTVVLRRAKVSKAIALIAKKSAMP